MDERQLSGGTRRHQDWYASLDNLYYTLRQNLSFYYLGLVTLEFSCSKIGLGYDLYWIDMWSHYLLILLYY